MALDKAKTVKLIIAAALVVVVVFLVGFFVGRSADKHVVRKYPKPVVAYIGTDKKPAISTEFIGDYILVTTDKGEKILANGLMVLIYEDKYYYEETNYQKSTPKK